MTARSLAAAVVVLVALGAAPAGADPDAASRAKAAAHFKQGKAFFEREDYDRALEEYQAALDLSAEPVMIFNIALCYDRAKRPEQALESFRRYLELAPEGAVADEAREDVARLVPIVEKIADDRTAEQARLAEEAHRREEAAKRDALRARSAEPVSRVPVYVMAAGAAVVVIGATSHVLAWRTRTRMVEAQDPDAYFAERDTFALERGVAIGGYVAGALTVATGVILGYVFRSRGGAEVSVAVTPGAAGLAVGWSR